MLVPESIYIFEEAARYLPVLSDVIDSQCIFGAFVIVQLTPESGDL